MDPIPPPRPDRPPAPTPVPAEPEGPRRRRSIAIGLAIVACTVVVSLLVGLLSSDTPAATDVAVPSPDLAGDSSPSHSAGPGGGESPSVQPSLNEGDEAYWELIRFAFMEECGHDEYCRCAWDYLRTHVTLEEIEGWGMSGSDFPPEMLPVMKDLVRACSDEL